MRIAVISDIHGNLAALEAVVDDFKARRADKVVVLGDVAFGGPRSRECLEFVLDLQPAAFILGNTDEWLTAGLPPAREPESKAARRAQDVHTWTVEQLGDALSVMTSWSFSYETEVGEERALFFHATPASNTESVPLSSPDEVLEEHFRHPHANVFVGGHVHVPGVRRLSQRRLVINAGSVGLPFDGDWRASYAILEGDGQRTSVNLIRVPYDIDRTVRDARDTGMPWPDEYIAALQQGLPL